MRLDCSRCGKSFNRKPSEVAARSFCTRRCYEDGRAETRTSYPRVGAVHAHRLAAERAIGRALRPGEIVHHINEDRQDFRASNLEVVPSQAEHARRHFLGSKQSPTQIRKRVEATLKTKALRQESA